MISTCMPKGVTSLKGGGVSIVFHIPHEIAHEGLALHALQDEPVELTIKKLVND